MNLHRRLPDGRIAAVCTLGDIQIYYPRPMTPEEAAELRALAELCCRHVDRMQAARPDPQPKESERDLPEID